MQENGEYGGFNVDVVAAKVAPAIGVGAVGTIVGVGVGAVRDDVVDALADNDPAAY